ncbi:hypothetical protein NI17_008790 [Thermobifida halotolerans]|uniref:Uncharacterized protein n=1 Tax=Thermobifida halotolerans TaxID=483545 RepID=A0A399G4X1_9ACTN|nr:hypothetical protein [Thermobifida halotolerans]UOE21217.1 hypothetical protein NI17_008790 [Thermobifida halotolerans]
MRPSPDELLDSLRLSLNETLLPKVEDRWARYVGTAMDLVLQHLKLRLAHEGDALAEDDADMLAVLAALSARAAALAGQETGGGAPRWEELAELVAGAARSGDTEARGATARNEELRGVVVAVMRWLDEADSADPAVREMRDEVYRLVRRQVDRTRPLVEPLFMSFRPVAS